MSSTGMDVWLESHNPSLTSLLPAPLRIEKKLSRSVLSFEAARKSSNFHSRNYARFRERSLSEDDPLTALIDLEISQDVDSRSPTQSDGPQPAKATRAKGIDRRCAPSPVPRVHRDGPLRMRKTRGSSSTSTESCRYSSETSYSGTRSSTESSVDDASSYATSTTSSIELSILRLLGSQTSKPRSSQCPSINNHRNSMDFTAKPASPAQQSLASILEWPEDRSISATSSSTKGATIPYPSANLHQTNTSGNRVKRRTVSEWPGPSMANGHLLRRLLGRKKAKESGQMDTNEECKRPLTENDSVVCAPYPISNRVAGSHLDLSTNFNPKATETSLFGTKSTHVDVLVGCTLRSCPSASEISDDGLDITFVMNNPSFVSTDCLKKVETLLVKAVREVLKPIDKVAPHYSHHIPHTAWVRSYTA